MAIILLWIAGAGFFVAFHPNGVTDPDGKEAKNPSDVLKYFMLKARGGSGGSPSGFGGGGSFGGPSSTSGGGSTGGFGGGGSF